jgi:hypothetical protein
MRSFSAPRDDEEERNAAMDRSHLWGRIVVAAAIE